MQCGGFGKVEDEAHVFFSLGLTFSIAFPFRSLKGIHNASIWSACGHVKSAQHWCSGYLLSVLLSRTVMPMVGTGSVIHDIHTLQFSSLLSKLCRQSSPRLRKLVI